MHISLESLHCTLFHAIVALSPRDNFRTAYGMILLNLINEFERNLDWEMQFDFILLDKYEFVIHFIVKGRMLKSKHEKLLGKFMPTKKSEGSIFFARPHGTKS